MTAKEINDRWISIQERREEIVERKMEGELTIVLDELAFMYNHEKERFRKELIDAGLSPILAKVISKTIAPEPDDDED